ncbi:MAG: class I SAM-dependent methyltransferase, partial [Bacteroidaceae bacterium]|nr:class I SAM-dependent methyltransferase [Bacteroidaceae bacterium]
MTSPHLHDPMGAAIADYFRTDGKTTGRLRVFSPMFEEDEIPLETLFRAYDAMPPLEQQALQLAAGKILDVGAGAGCHSLALQDMGKAVTAIDISELSVETMRKRGVKEARLQDFWLVEDRYDTLLMLMNGIGLIGTLDRLPAFFDRLRKVLTPQGQVLLDSSDICYVFETEDDVIEIPDHMNYYGELTYQMQYKRIRGESFPWLYIDPDLLQEEAEKNG